MTNSDKVINRIKSAVKAGVKTKSIATKSGVSYFRVSSVVNTESYRQCTKFTDEEATSINTVLDGIQSALNEVL